MNRMFHWKTYFTALGLMLGFMVPTSMARAGFEFNANLTGLSSSNDTVTVSGQSTTGGSFKNKSVIAAQIDWSVTSGLSQTAGLVTNGNFSTFCIEIPQTVVEGQNYEFQSEPLTSLPTTGPMLTSTQITDLSLLWGSTYNTLTTSAEYAAFQIAIWTIVYGDIVSDSPTTTSLSDPEKTVGRTTTNTGTFTSGTFTVSGGNSQMNSIVLEAYNMLENLVNGKDTQSANLIGFALGTNGQNQDQLAALQNGYYLSPNDTIVAAPAPPALVLALIGIFLCLTLRHRLLGAKVA